ncbi:hypothetical protein JYT31_03500, partial [Beggiatoa alba]|nr:hypothetical protein [Beggiatoa alba]
MSKKDKPLGTTKHRNNRQVNKSGLTLNTISLLAFVVFSITFIVMLFIMRWSTLNIIDKQNDAAKQNSANLFVSRLSLSIARYSNGVRFIAEDPQTLEVLLSNDAAKIAQRQRQLLKLFPDGLSFRLLNEGDLRTTRESTPHIGYACVDLFNQSRQTQRPPGVETHVFGTAQQHIDFVHPVLNKARTKVLGHVQLTVNVNILSKWLKLSDQIDYVELYQQVGQGAQPLLITQAGTKLLRRRDNAQQYPIPGTKWELKVWPSLSIGAQYDHLLSYSLLLIGVAIFALLTYLLRRSLSFALLTDIRNLVRIVADSIRGENRYQYKLEMKEFNDVANQLNDLLSQQSSERERDSEPQKIDTSSLEMDIPPSAMFATHDSMEVHELDETAMAKLAMAELSQQKSNSESNQSMQPPIQETSETPTNTTMPALPPAEIFKAYDIRGIVGVSLSADYAELIGKAIGSEAVARGATSIAFARDGRLSGPLLGQALVKGMMSTGMDVIDIGMVPTPLLYYAAHKLTSASGVMLTGSHNPPDYNGFKMMLAGETLSEDSIQGLRKRIESADFTTGSGNYTKVPVLDKYIQRVISDVKPKRPLKIVVDCGNGVAGGVAPRLYKAMGCEVVELYCDIDGEFPNHHPD